MNKRTLQPVSNCFRVALFGCQRNTQEGFLSVLESLTNSAFLTHTGDNTPSLFYRTVNSVKVFGDELNICESEYQDNEDDEMDPTRTAEDMQSSIFV
ncbi:uncharacterized protein CEXT_692651 [Caerostris extrusa]|uniref:Uncharacterized protein n=1 Tax=Caerostris extrusa TaxID=172846 RepID=A0AAV4V861_CAEEX|nr:uncharacterized protein CEXT_692651 [Caerostris extrusa]